MKKMMLSGLLLIAVAAAVSAAGQVPEPDHITVQHILIGFKGSIPNSPQITRTQAEAEALANQIFERARKGEDFEALVKTYTEDQFPGIYGLANTGITPDAAQQEVARGRFVKAFADVSFSLKVGEIGMAVYDPQTSKYGWHIIKRIK